MLTLASRIMTALVATLFVVASASAEPFEEGKHYTVITPAIKVGKDSEVIVTEFFWYGCAHCYAFEDMLHAWADKLPEGARLEPSPAMWARGMDLHARAYYVAKSLKVLDQVQTRAAPAQLNAERAVEEVHDLNFREGSLRKIMRDNALRVFNIKT